MRPSLCEMNRNVVVLGLFIACNFCRPLDAHNYCHAAYEGDLEIYKGFSPQLYNPDTGRCFLYERSNVSIGSLTNDFCVQRGRAKFIYHPINGVENTFVFDGAHLNVPIYIGGQLPSDVNVATLAKDAKANKMTMANYVASKIVWTNGYNNGFHHFRDTDMFQWGCYDADKKLNPSVCRCAVMADELNFRQWQLGNCEQLHMVLCVYDRADYPKYKDSFLNGYKAGYHAYLGEGDGKVPRNVEPTRFHLMPIDNPRAGECRTTTTSKDSLPAATKKETDKPAPPPVNSPPANPAPAIRTTKYNGPSTTTTPFKEIDNPNPGDSNNEEDESAADHFSPLLCHSAVVLVLSFLLVYP